MALHTFGTVSATALQAALTFSEALADPDIGAVATQIAADRWTAAPATVPGASGPAGIIATGTTSSSSPSVTSVTFVAGGPLAAIQQGMLVLAQGIVPGTFAVSFSGTTLVLSQNPTASASGVYLLIIPAMEPGGRFSRNGLLDVPNRGVLKMRRGDVVAVDNTGWPILVSGSSVNYGGSLWTLT